MTEAQYPRYQEPPPALKRNYTGWIFLAVLFVLLIASALLSTTVKVDESKDDTHWATEIKEAMATQALTNKLTTVTKGKVVLDKKGKSPTKQDDSGSKQVDPLEDVLQNVAPQRFKDINAAEVYGIVSYELHKPVQASDLAILKKGTQRQKNVCRILTEKSLSPVEAGRLTQNFPQDSFLRALVVADAYSKAGDPGPRKKLLGSLETSRLQMVGLAVLVFLGGGVAWVTFAVLKSQGLLKPLGLPNPAEDVYAADRWAAKAVLFFGVYVFGGVLIELVSVKSQPLAVLGAVMAIGYFFLLFRVRLGGGPVTFESLGMGKDSPWLKYIMFGAVGFLMEFPVTMGMGFLGEKLFSHQTFSHPAAVELVNSHEPWKIVSLFLLASVQAPLFEEIVFRGMMLPAIAKFVGLIPSILITSALFACLHPQGVGAWLGLATVAVGSSVLIYHTKSLVPSFILHGLHNGLTLCFVILMS